MTAHLSVDFGARFADFVAWDDRALRVAKVPNDAPMAEVMAAGLAELQVEGAALATIRMVTTAPLNALLDRAPAPVALLTTRGFADTLRLGRQNRVALYDPVATSPAPAFLVAPEHIHEVTGRIDAQGAEVTPLDEAELAAAIEAIRAAGLRAVAVCFLFSHLSPAHELRAAEALRAALPGVTVSLSHVVDPAPREYDRTVSAALDAWIAARCDEDLARFRAALPEGFTGDLLLGEGRGVLVPAADYLRQRALLLTGAPAAATRAGAVAAGDVPEALVVDIGSQSADIALIREGDPVAVDYSRFAGVDLRAPSVDMASLGLGGRRRVRREGATLRFDATGAGAPTLDDALARLGLLPAEEGAEARLSTLGEDTEAVARQIRAAAAERMALELIRHATRRNVDPSRVQLCVMGGGGPLLASAVAEAMGLIRVSIPRAPAVAGAMGLAQAPRRAEASVRVNRALADLTDADLAALLAELDPQATGAGAPVVTLTLAARAQMHPLQLALTPPPETVEEIRAELTRAYAAHYGVAPPGPGHVFALRLHRDAVSALPPVAEVPAIGAGLIATEAGAIHCPEGWRLTAGPAAYLLERTEG